MVYHIMNLKITKDSTKAIYSFLVKTTDGMSVSLEQYRGQVLLIVNTASECGFTPQYNDLEILHQQYKNRGFSVLAFPSNDFGKQEPLQGKAISEYCSLHFRTTFPVFDKIKVIGLQAAPLYRFLSNKSENGKVNISPKWNFQKYLINREGEVVDYFLPFTKPTSSGIKRAIEKLL